MNLHNTRAYRNINEAFKSAICFPSVTKRYDSLNSIGMNLFDRRKYFALRIFAADHRVTYSIGNVRFSLINGRSIVVRRVNEKGKKEKNISFNKKKNISIPFALDSSLFHAHIGVPGARVVRKTSVPRNGALTLPCLPLRKLYPEKRENIFIVDRKKMKR